jgi:hypothetical protein
MMIAMDTAITSVDGLIEALGGTKQVAAWADIDPSAVSHWRRDGEIPPAWHFRLFALCAERGLALDTARIFGVAVTSAAA